MEAGLLVLGDTMTHVELAPHRRITQARGFTLWLTGRSGAGKSTLAAVVADELRRGGVRVETLDGDEVRQNLSKGLGFSREKPRPLERFWRTSSPSSVSTRTPPRRSSSATTAAKVDLPAPDRPVSQSAKPRACVM